MKDGRGTGIEVWQAFLPFPSESVSHLSTYLSDSERKRAARLLDPEAGDRFRCGRGLLRHLLGRRLGRLPEELVLKTETGGRPYLDETPGIQPSVFSISHSHDILLIAIHDSGLLGVDVERIRPNTDMAAIVRRFFRPDEREAWERLPAADREAAFLRLWTRKEAILKALGCGLTGLDRLSVSLEEGTPHPVTWLADDPLAPGRWWCHSWVPIRAVSSPGTGACQATNEGNPSSSAAGSLATLAFVGSPPAFTPRIWHPDFLSHRP